MSTRLRLAGWLGIAFVVLVLASAFIAGSPPAIDDPAGEIREFLVDKQDQLRAGALIGAAATPLFLVYLAALRQAMVRAGDEAAFWARVATWGGIITAVLATAGGALGAVPVLVDDFAAGASDDTILAFWYLGFVLFMAAGAGLFTFLGASALAVLRGGALTRWLGWLAAVGAIVGLAGLLGFVEADLVVVGFTGLFFFAAFVVASSVVLLRAADTR